MVLGAYSQSPPIVQGIGVIGFADADSVMISLNATDSTAYSAIYVHSVWPEMSGKVIWGQYVVPCLSDSAGWYKIVFTEYQFTPEGDYLSMPPYVAYIRHSNWVEYQSWNDYLVEKYIYFINTDIIYYSEMNGTSPFECSQNDCVTVTDAQGEWMQVSTIPYNDCSEFGPGCLQDTWFKWHDGNGILNVRLLPFY